MHYIFYWAGDLKKKNRRGEMPGKKDDGDER